MSETPESEYEALWNDEGAPEETPAVETEPDSEEAVSEDPPEDLPEETSEEPASVDYQAELAELRHRLQSAEGRAKAFQQRYEQLQPPPQQPAAPQDDEEAFLQRFRQEYNDDVVRAIDLISSRRARELVSDQLNRLAPVEQGVQTALEQLHFQTIETVHPDVSEINESPAFEAWISSRPVHLRPAYQRVRDQGSPAEVISLLDEYKAATKPTTNGAPAGAARVAAATPVRPRRGALPAKQEDPANGDWDALWKSVPD